ncbi:MAG: class I SAM-dependent methyltransferase [Pseudomonadota bacterium]
MNQPQEPQAVAERYARRSAADRYSLLRPDVWQSLQERQRAEWRLWARLGWHDLSQRRYCEVGCGAGGALLEALRAGFMPEHLTGLELLPERHAMARRVLPEAVTLYLGDALAAPVAEASQDVVAQHTVFSSLLDDAFQERLAATLWRWVKPGGGVLWYDFTVDNPRNRDVRGVPLKRVRALFPEGRLQSRRVTLAPPLARLACRVHPGLYTALNTLPLLRTHLLCWIEKPLQR